MTLNSLQENVNSLVYADDFKVTLGEGLTNTSGYSVYDKDYNRLVHRTEELQLPAKAGDYYVSVIAGWRKEDTYGCIIST